MYDSHPQCKLTLAHLALCSSLPPPYYFTSLLNL